MGSAIKQPKIKTSEKDFRQMVCELARLLKWEYYFTWLSIHSPSGFLDLVLVKPPQIIFVELKTDVGKLSSNQKRWIELLEACGCDVRIWRPMMWDEIVDRLKR